VALVARRKEEGIVKVKGSPGEGSRRELSLARRASFVLGFLMARYTDAALPHIDAAG